MPGSTALRRLVHELIDYAGLFPPASLTMSEAVQNYAAYRTSQHAWMLGRFICPAARVHELADAFGALRSPPRSAWRISVVAGADLPEALHLVDAFNRTQAGRLRADTIELRVTTPEEVDSAALLVRERFACFLEFPLHDDPARFAQAVAGARVMAKARTGGVTPEAIPTAEQLARFMEACSAAGTAFKATAGLHHPFRSEHRLTYEEQSPRATMHGFLNVFVAAAFACKGVRGRELEEVLADGDPTALAMNTSLTWRGRRLNDDDLRIGRSFARAFGSCSFIEPVDDLLTLKLL